MRYGGTMPFTLLAVSISELFEEFQAGGGSREFGGLTTFCRHRRLRLQPRLADRI
jgi:hypothetical protein